MTRTRATPTAASAAPAARPDARVHPLRSGAGVRSTTACASSAIRSSCRSRRRRRCTASPRSGSSRSSSSWRSPGARSCPGPARSTATCPGVDRRPLRASRSRSPSRTRGSKAAATTCTISDPPIVPGVPIQVVQTPLVPAGSTISFTAAVDRLGIGARGLHRRRASRRDRGGPSKLRRIERADLAFATRWSVRARRGPAGRSLREGRAHRLQVGEGRCHRGRPPVRGAHHRCHPGRATRATGSSPRRAASTPARAGTDDGRGRAWVIDPLDGTINYANGIPFFCVSIAWWSMASRGRRHPGSDPWRDVRGDGRWPGDARRRADPCLGQGSADPTSSSRWHSPGLRSSPALAPCARPFACRARWAPRRWPSPTWATAGSTPSSSRAGCRCGTSPPPVSSPSAAARR